MPVSVLTGQHDGSATTLDFCAICTALAEKPVLVRCGHRFCLSCAEAWFVVDSRCPSCGSDVEFVRVKNARKKTIVPSRRLDAHVDEGHPFPIARGVLFGQVATLVEKQWDERFASHPVVAALRASAQLELTGNREEVSRRRWESFAASVEACALRQEQRRGCTRRPTLQREGGAAVCLLDDSRRNRHAVGSCTTKQDPWSERRLRDALDAVDEKHAAANSSGSLRHACDEYAVLLLAEGENASGNASRYPRYLSHLGKRPQGKSAEGNLVALPGLDDSPYFTLRSELFQEGAAQRAFEVLSRRAEVTIHGCASSQRANRRCSIVHGIAKYVSLARAHGRVPLGAGDAEETFLAFAECKQSPHML